MNFFKNLSKRDASQEHQISLPGLDIAFNHELKIVFVVDQTGSADDFAMSQLSAWVEKQGYFLHCVVVTAPENTNGNS